MLDVECWLCVKFPLAVAEASLNAGGSRWVQKEFGVPSGENMATANGTRTPPDHMHDATDGKTASTNSTDKKRKREDDLEPEHASRPTTSRNAQSQRDILEILER